MTVGQTKALREEKKQDGFSLHGRKSDCTDGCQLCHLYREAINWPAGIPLETNLAQLGREKLEGLVSHFSIPVGGIISKAGNIP